MHWDTLYKKASEQSVLKGDHLIAGKLDKCNDVSNSDKRQFMMASTVLNLKVNKMFFKEKQRVKQQRKELLFVHHSCPD